MIGFYEMMLKTDPRNFSLFYCNVFFLHFLTIYHLGQVKITKGQNSQELGKNLVKHNFTNSFKLCSVKVLKLWLALILIFPAKNTYPVNSEYEDHSENLTQGF